MDLISSIMGQISDLLQDNDRVSFVMDDEELTDELTARYGQVIEEYVDKWRKTVEKEQLKLDSIENYIIESKICEDIDLIEEDSSDDF